MNRKRRRLLPIAAAGTSVPLIVLFAITVIDEYGEQAFQLLSPEIRAAFNLTNLAFGSLFSMFTFIAVATALGFGWLGDRWIRVRLVQIGAAMGALGALIVGTAGNVFALFFGRLIGNTAYQMPVTAHNSLVADLYEPEQRTFAYGIHEGGRQFAYILVPLVAASLAATVGWRMAFLAMLPALVLAGAAALVLREPVRGGTEGRADAAAAAVEPPVPMRVAFRQIIAIRTLRRTWIAQALVFSASIPYFAFASIYLQASFGATVFQRGLIGALGSVFGVLGLLAGSRVAQTALRHGIGRLQRLVGLVISMGGFLLAAYALMPTLGAAVVLGSAAAFVFAMNQSALLVIVSLVAPPRLRTQAFSYGQMLGLVGVITPPIAGAIIDASGIRLGLLAMTPMLVIGGIVLASAGKFAAADHQRAVATLDLASQLRAERLAAREQSLLVCRQLDVYYGNIQVLYGVDFVVRKGEVIALLGTNGSGKSTLLKAVAGILNARSGHVFFDGVDITNNGPWDTAEAGVVLMPGGKSVFPLSVQQNLELAAWLTRRDKRATRRRIDEVLDLFPRVRERLDQPAANLSGGEQQQLALAQALMPKPKILLIDEMSLGLSPKLVGEIVQILRRAHEQEPDLTLVLVEQSVNVAMTLAERAYFLEKGQVRFSGLTADLLERPDILRAVFLEGAEKAARALT